METEYQVICDCGEAFIPSGDRQKEIQFAIWAGGHTHAATKHDTEHCPRVYEMSMSGGEPEEIWNFDDWLNANHQPREADDADPG